MTTCDDARDAAPELALGTLDGGERAALLRHLSTCPACRDETARLVETAEAIGLLAPPVLPSVGFEDRVLASMGPVTPAVTPAATPLVARRRRWLSRSLVVLAAAAVVAAILTIGSVVLSHPNESTVASATMIGAGGQAVGTAYVSSGHPALVVVKVDYPFTAGVFHLQAVSAGGQVDTLGDLVSVNGAWRWSGLANGAEVQSLRVVDAGGLVTCEGRVT
jgi:anti-sigma factor RsiW